MGAKIRYAQPRDNVSFPVSCRAWVAEDNGKILAEFGVYQLNGRWCFAGITDEMKATPVRLVRLARAWLSDQTKSEYLFAAADPDIPGSDRFLEVIGFSPLGDGVYVA